MSGVIRSFPQSIDQSSSGSHGYHTAQDSDVDIWAFVHCDICMLPFIPSPNEAATPFWLTECGHVLCNAHINSDRSCRRCGSTNVGTSSLRQDLNTPMAQWFSNVPSALEMTARTVRFQQATIAAEARFYKEKSLRQRSELDKRRAIIIELQSKCQTLQQEVHHLRSQPHQSGIVQSLGKKRRLDSGSANTLVSASDASPYQSLNHERRASSSYSFTEASPRRNILTPVVAQRLTLPVDQPQPVFQRPQSVLQPVPQKAGAFLSHFAYEPASAIDERGFEQQHQVDEYQNHNSSHRQQGEPTSLYRSNRSPASTRSQRMMPPPSLPLRQSDNRAQFKPNQAHDTSGVQLHDSRQPVPTRYQQQPHPHDNPRGAEPTRTPFNPIQIVQTLASRPILPVPRKSSYASAQQTPLSSRAQAFRPASTVQGIRLPLRQNVATRAMGGKGGSYGPVNGGLNQLDQRAASAAPRPGNGGQAVALERREYEG
ncbi:hypothetical protein FRB93_004748 [Tulasnella sp. JGI-2019a]|nr:hypothetical protein FRB93_004748 [Tulasnella sp. JGI-2019a]